MHPEEIANAVVHEAVHCVLLMLDHEDPLLTDDEAADALGPVVSPWTGKPLPVPTYLHACYVWFGLANFWRLAAGANRFDAEQCEHLLTRATAGFQRGPVLGRLKLAAQRLLSDRTEAEIGEIERSAAGVGSPA